jgi:hypothetical protein
MKTYVFYPFNPLAQFEQEPRRRVFRKVSAGDEVQLSDERAAEVRALHGTGALWEITDKEPPALPPEAEAFLAGEDEEKPAAPKKTTKSKAKG